MLNVLDRVGTPTVTYLLFAALVWHYKQHLPQYLTYALLLLSTVWIVNLNVTHFDRERRISALGARAPRIRIGGPGNCGFIILAIYHFVKHRAHDFWINNFKTAGSKIGKDNAWTFESITMGERLILTADEENVKAILATQFQDFGKGEVFQSEWDPFLGHSIFTTDGQQWHDSRMLLRPQFIKDRVSDLHIFEHHIQTLLPLLRGSHDAATVRVDDLFFRFTLDAATDFLFGFSVDSLTNAASDFARYFADVQHVQATMARSGPLKALIPTRKYYDGLKHLNAFIDRFIDEALSLSQDELEKKVGSDDYTFLHAIAGYTRNRKLLRDQIAAVLLAGRDTTAVTLSWLFYELSRHPDVVQKLRSEIEQHVGLDIEKKPTYDNLKSMRYLQHTLNEVLRLYPVVPYNVRVAMKDTTLPRGGGPDGTQPIGVLKGTPCGYSTFVMQRRADIYPSESSGFPPYLEFVPERWDSWRPKALSYIPFNAGPRICIGQQFALTEMGYTTVRILQYFSKIEDKTVDFPGTKTDIVLQPANGVRVAFFEA